MEQLAATVQQNSANVVHASSGASDAATVAGKGGELTAKVVATMAKISQSSRKVAEINGIIEAIALQTYILALNAAVEAARAGEQVMDGRWRCPGDAICLITGGNAARLPAAGLKRDEGTSICYAAGLAT